jgi:hypothetical protein
MVANVQVAEIASKTNQRKILRNYQANDRATRCTARANDRYAKKLGDPLAQAFTRAGSSRGSRPLHLEKDQQKRPHRECLAAAGSPMLHGGAT